MSKGSAKFTVLLGGRYVQQEFKADMAGMKFEGIGLSGYDNGQQKYVGTWIDNMSTGIMTSEGTADSTGILLMWTGQMADPMTGKLEKLRMTTRFIDDNKHVFTMYMKGPDKKEFQTMEITYERKM